MTKNNLPQAPLFNRANIATLLLILLAFNAAIRGVHRNVFFHWDKIPAAEAARQENRLQGIKMYLPKRGIVGFVQDPALPFIEKVRRYYLTQYTLVPLIILESDELDLIVANFEKETDLKKWVREKPFAVIKDLNNGVALLKRENQ